MKSKNKQGLTLIELVVSVAILVIITTMSAVALSGETSKARDSRRFADLKTIEDAISSSNSKNRAIKYNQNYVTTGIDSYLVTNVFQEDSNANSHRGVRILRNAKTVEIGKSFIEGTILSKISRDPKGQAYLAAFLNDNLYQLFGVKENAETKIPRAIVQGTFQAGSVVDNLLEDISNTDQILKVGNAKQFIMGDVISIDNEEMVVIATIFASNEIVVTRSSTSRVHKMDVPIKIAKFAPGAESLLCYGKLAEIKFMYAGYRNIEGDVKLIKDANGNGIPLPPNSITYADDNYVCAGFLESPKNEEILEGSITNGGLVIPYAVNSQ